MPMKAPPIRAAIVSIRSMNNPHRRTGNPDCQRNCGNRRHPWRKRNAGDGGEKRHGKSRRYNCKGQCQQGEKRETDMIKHET